MQTSSKIPSSSIINSYSAHQDYLQHKHKQQYSLNSNNQKPLSTSINVNNTKKIHHYLIFLNQLLGKGSFAKVYKGLNLKTNEQIAVKILELKYITQNRLYSLLNSEIQVLKSLRHPNILRCYDVLFSQTNCYIITQLCQQGQLSKYINKVCESMSSSTTTSLLVNNNNIQQQQKNLEKLIYDIYQGLMYLQRKFIVHRDIKMTNVLVKNGRAKIADFGFAKYTNQQFHDQHIIGSPIYMSPQALFNQIYGPKTDVWAFGILIYEFFHGYSPYQECKSHQQLQKRIKQKFSYDMIKVFMSEEVIQLIIRCLQYDKDKRPFFRELWGLRYIKQLRYRNNGLVEKIVTLNQSEQVVGQEMRNLQQNNLYQSQANNNNSYGFEFEDFLRFNNQNSNLTDQKEDIDQQMEEFYKNAEKLMSSIPENN